MKNLKRVALKKLQFGKNVHTYSRYHMTNCQTKPDYKMGNRYLAQVEVNVERNIIYAQGKIILVTERVLK